MHDFLYVSHFMYTGYYKKINKRYVLQTGLIFPAWVDNILKNEFKNYADIKVFKDINNANIFKRQLITTRQLLYKLIKQHKIEGICCLDNYLYDVKNKKDKTKLVQIKHVLEEFINRGGAVIINNQAIHKYMRTTKNNWYQILGNKIMK